MAINVRPAVEADLPTLTSLVLEADAAHPIVALPWANPAVAYEFFLQHLTFFLFDPLSHVLVATTAGGDTAGYITWQEAGDEAEWNPVFPEGTNKKVFQTWLSAQSAKTPYVLPGSAELTGLSVFPRCQGQGVGQALVGSCAEQLDGKHLVCIVSSSIAGKRVYEKLGFGVLRELTTDYSEFGGGQRVTYIMRRDAKKAVE